ncbi:MAG: glycoside hydrolase family 20 zincin-like fold domain-containing protein [Acidimicrobiales bacterium]
MVPVPRQIEHLGGAGSLTVIDVVVDPTVPPQGYDLHIAAGGTTIRHADDSGLRYAHQTLAGLAAQPGVRAQRITDHPDLLRRGFMLDISRDRVPTNATLEWLVGVLAELRYNHLELYMEHTFAYVGHEEVWRAASPLTSEDVRRLDGLCAAHGIELVANQNTFGHMERWLRHERYRSRAECPDGATSPFGGRSMPPATLAPTRDNAVFAVGLVRELASHFTSKMVNIGADEPFELGQGVSAPAVVEHGRAAVYLDHLDRLIRPLASDGHHVLFWGDVLRRHPDLVARLPTLGSSAVVWNYEAPASGPGLLAALGPDLLDTLGLPDDAHLGFAAHARTFVQTGYPFWVTPGTSSWNSLLGRWANARENLLDAALVGRSEGAGGYLVADWGDSGHLQPLVVSLLPLVYGAGVSWCAETNAGCDLTTAVDALAGVDGLGALLTELGDVHLLSGVTSFNGSPLFAALDPARPLPLIGKGTEEGHRATLDVLDSALDRLDGGLPQNGRSLTDDLNAAVRLARHGAWRLAHRGGVAVPSADAMAADLAECVDLQRRAWLASSRPGGLEDSLRHLPTQPSS